MGKHRQGRAECFCGQRLAPGQYRRHIEGLRHRKNMKAKEKGRNAKPTDHSNNTAQG